MASSVTDPINIPYGTIPHFPPTNVGQVIAGSIEGTPVIMMQGMYHQYDGYTPRQCAMFVRVLKLLGIENVIIANASSAINTSYKLGDVMLIKDHYNILGDNPLIGPNDERFGPRFTPLNKAYDKELLTKAKEVFQEINYEGTVHEGVYAVCCAPTFPTVAETAFLNQCGVDAIGMTILLEVIVAKHCGLGVMAFNIIVGESNLDQNKQADLSPNEITELCNKKCEQLSLFLRKYVGGVASYHPPRVEAVQSHPGSRAADVTEAEGPQQNRTITCCKCKKQST